MTQDKILLIEDDHRLAELTQQFLHSNGFTTDIAVSGREALRSNERHEYALILLDLNLPDIDGVKLCTQLRDNFSHPIIMLTARDSIMDEIIGLDAGADDYLKKPIDPSLLISRVKAALRRQTARLQQNHCITIGPLSINGQTREAKLDDITLELGRLEFDLLLYFCNNSDKILSRNTLSHHTRGIDYDGVDRTIDIKISKLRKKLEYPHQDRDIIKTIWGKGYLFNSMAWD